MKDIKILIVEDEGITAMDIESRLKDLGYSVVGIASSGEEAISFTKNLKPNLILMDIVLKGKINGIQAAQTISSKLQIPIIFLTAYSDDDTFDRAKLSGPYSYLTKPFETNALRYAIELALYKHYITAEQLKIEQMKNEFIAVASHELRTPLTSIHGSLSLLIGGSVGKIPDKATKLLEIAKRNCERLIRLINDILDVEKSGKMEFKLKPHHIDLIVKEAIISNQAYAQKFGLKINLVKQVSELVNVDRDRLIQVLTNLISNAIKFSAPNNDVKISITEQEDNQIRVSVSNKGIGIAKEFQARIFQKFAQAYTEGEHMNLGTGLGLTISKEIIEKLNGTINYNSEPDGETTFYFELPIFQELLEQKTIFEKIPTLLICEEDDNTSNQLKGVLQENKFNVIVTNRAKDAKVILADDHVDALLVDQVLPDQDAISFISELRRIYSILDLPIILISATSEQEKKELEARALSVFDWIDKPLENANLLESSQKIKKYIELNTPTILHVEADLNLVQAVANLVKDEATIIATQTLQQARNELEKTNFDLVLLDLELSDGSGLELLPLISQKNIPVIVFSAFDLPKGYVHFVVKELRKSKLSKSKSAKLSETESSSKIKKDERHEVE